ncbi:MAG: TatD family hydrolase [Phycisphaerae bacterium]|nr:TatD family hydrolase [Phycisphaerae bacterium]
MIDCHCHIDLYQHPEKVADRCRVLAMRVLSVTTTPSAWTKSSRLAGGSEHIHTALGLHPQIAHERHVELDLFDSLVEKAKWIGEIGLDGSPELRDHWPVQVRVFRHILQTVSHECGRVMSIHTRRAVSPVLEALYEYPQSGLAVLHWFAGTQAELKKAIEYGCWFSVGLPMLKTAKGRALVEKMPRDRVLTETDGPFVRRNGMSCFPWDVEITTTELATLWCMDQGDLRGTLDENFRKLESHAIV